MPAEEQRWHGRRPSPSSGVRADAGGELGEDGVGVFGVVEPHVPGLGADHPLAGRGGTAVQPTVVQSVKTGPTARIASAQSTTGSAPTCSASYGATRQPALRFRRPVPLLLAAWLIVAVRTVHGSAPRQDADSAKAVDNLMLTDGHGPGFG